MKSRLNFDGELLPIKYSNSCSILAKVYIDNVSISSVGVFFSNLFRFNEKGCFKLNSVKKAKKW